MFDENNETNNYLFKEISFEQKDSIYDEKNFFIDKIFTQSNEKEDIFDLKNENNFDWENSEETNKNLNKKRNISKREEKLKKNAESQRKTRERKKELMNKLIEENMKLKSEIHELKKIIVSQICHKCKKEILEKKEIETKNIKTNNNLTNNKRKLLLFSTFSITIIFVLLSFNPIEKIKQLRNLNESYEDIFNVKYENLEIRNFTLALIYILFGDYYSLVKRKNFLYNENNIIYSFKNKGKVRIVKERDLSINLDEKDCEDCIVELEQNNVVLKKSSKGFQFKLILSPKRININGNEFEINSFVQGLPVSIYEIDSYAFGFSKDEVYFN